MIKEVSPYDVTNNVGCISENFKREYINKPKIGEVGISKSGFDLILSKNKTDQVTYDVLEKALTFLYRICKEKGLKTITMPRVGCMRVYYKEGCYPLK